MVKATYRDVLVKFNNELLAGQTRTILKSGRLLVSALIDTLYLNTIFSREGEVGMVTYSNPNIQTKEMKLIKVTLVSKKNDLVIVHYLFEPI
jgi:hypothetical protein